MGKKDREIYSLKMELRSERTRLTNCRSKNEELQKTIDAGGMAYLEKRRRALASRLLTRVFSTRGDKVDWYELNEDACGIYFLIDDDKVVYVGQSKDIHSRAKQHRQDGKVFEQVRFFTCEPKHLLPLENAMIRILQPPLNTMGNPAKCPSHEYLKLKKIIDFGELGLA